ncbi:PP2C family protein-serine/threonine phosphatase [Streptomyces beigongshangae]|uniref:PP2C family protein-serine/threonine phosphatase n=1 Tax=Streptomyces beigongshangae TaxID=2841597 RepID=UPI001C8454E2|nr:GAF domain-containing SpoIIE family protein phosphatase [Streptomyces sp. REN17]
MTTTPSKASPALPVDEETRRLAAVHRYLALDTPPDGTFDRIASLAARIFDAPMATVTIVGSDRVWVKGAHGLPGPPRTGRVPGLCASAVLQDGPYVVTDARTDSRTRGNPLVEGDPGVRFYAAAPLTTAHGQRLGTVDVLDTRPRRPTGAQLDSLRELAALAMDAFELRLSAARTIAAERERRTGAERLARALQRTLLPPTLPEVPGLQAAAAYHTASQHEVGGDFYDLFPLDDGRWAFFLGDVCGKGADAAALTSLTRYTLRAAAIYDPDPCAALANLDLVLKGEYQGGAPRYCTAVFGVLEPLPDGSFSVTLAGGGHPPALALRADGTVQPISTMGGQLIGMLPAPRFVRTTTTLSAGESLLLYTDGLTEARTPDGAMLGEDGLTRYLAAAHAVGATDDPQRALLRSIETLLDNLGEGVSDDTALMALSVPAHPETPLQENR